MAELGLAQVSDVDELARAVAEVLRENSQGVADYRSGKRQALGFLVGQVVSLGSLIYAPLAQMAPFAIMLLILLLKPTGLYGSPLLKR